MFKPGDKVICVEGVFAGPDSYYKLHIKKDNIYTVHRANETHVYLEEDPDFGWMTDRFKLASKYPIHEKTVKVLVPGVYGRIRINNKQGLSDEVSIDFVYSNGKPLEAGFSPSLSAEELRDSASLLISLAEYLEEKED